jgi:hypothetical protein
MNRTWAHWSSCVTDSNSKQQELAAAVMMYQNRLRSLAEAMHNLTSLMGKERIALYKAQKALKESIDGDS